MTITSAAITAVASDNGDEAESFGPTGQFRFLGNFHKSLPHNEFGEVDPAAYEQFATAAADTAHPGDLDAVARGPLSAPGQAPLSTTPVGAPPVTGAAALNNPQCGYADDRVGPLPHQLSMPPPPRVLSHSAAAEITELYWMALLRDVSLDTLAGDPRAAAALADLSVAFDKGVTDFGDPGRLRVGLDLPGDAAGDLALSATTLFRCGLPAEDRGPLVSQYFLHDVPYGTFTVLQRQFPYAAGRDYLTDHATWLLAQNTGYDTHGRSYAGDNDYRDDPTAYEPDVAQRRIGSMRDLARFVNKDALHEAYFNAALLLTAWGARRDGGNPYGPVLHRQAGFGTLGDPHLLALVSEVATRALKTVWRQKWLVHRRLRPEAYAGLLHMQVLGHDAGAGTVTRPYGLPAWASQTAAAQGVRAQRAERGEADALFLPVAFTAGSPVHPAYGAGHATVAGACVTVLKAWFDEDAAIAPLIEAATHPVTRKPLSVRQPAVTTGRLPDYTGADVGAMTVGGELNKVACNVAMGRSMGGVHWRSDNTRSLRLGEQVAAVMLSRHLADGAERPVSMTFRSFDGHQVQVGPGSITVVGGDPAGAADLQAVFDSVLP